MTVTNISNPSEISKTTNYPIRYKDYISNRPAGKIESVFIAGTSGPEFAIRLKGRGGDGIQFDLVLIANAVRFVAELEPMVQRMKQTLNDARHAETEAIMRGETQAPQVERFSRGRQFDPGERALELRDHPGRAITAELLAQADDPAVRLGLLALRFPWLLIDDLGNTIIEDKFIKAAQHFLGGDDAGDGQFANDLATLQLMPPAALTKAGGGINLSAVARAVNRHTGGSDWSYVQELAGALVVGWANENAEKAA